MSNNPAWQSSTSPLSRKKKSSTFFKLKRVLRRDGDSGNINKGDNDRKDNSSRHGSNTVYDESGIISPSNSHAPLSTALSPMSFTPLTSNRSNSNADVNKNNNLSQKSFSTNPNSNTTTSQQQRHLAELYAQQRRHDPRLAMQDEISGRHVVCPPNGTLSKESYDDELCHQLKLARSEDRRGWEEREKRILELRRWQQQDQNGSLQQGQGRRSSQQQNQQLSIQYRENSTQSTRSETSSERSQTSMDRSHHSWMQQRIGHVGVGNDPTFGSYNNAQSGNAHSDAADGRVRNVDSRKIRHREARAPQQLQNQQQSLQQQQQHQRQNQEPQQNQQRQQQVKSNSTTTARHTPPPLLGPIAEESSPIMANDMSFDEIHVRGWSFDDDHYHRDNFNDDGGGSQPRQQFDDEVHFDDEEYPNDGQFREDYSGGYQHSFHSQQPSSQPNSNQKHLQFKPHPKKPSLTIDVVSDVSYHDDPSIDMMSSLATNDTNSLTDYNWRNSNHRSSSPTLDHYVVEEVEEESDEESRDIDRKEERQLPTTFKEKREASHADPPGTFIDDIQTSRGRIASNRLYHGRDPSVGGDSTRYSQPSVVRRMPPRGLSESPGRDRPWRQQATQSRGQPSRHSYESSRPSRNSYPFDPSQQQQPDDDPWDIEFVVAPDAHPTCEASSLGNLTGEYDLPPPNDGENDDDTATNTMNTVDLVAEVKRVWRHVQKYEKKKEQKKNLMAQYQNGGGVGEREVQDSSMEEMIGRFHEMNQQEVNLDDTRVSELTGFSQIHSSGAAMKSYGAGVPNNSGGRRSPLEQHIEQTRGQNFQFNSPGQSYNNASHASTEKDVAFVNDGVDLFFDESQAPMNANINTVHPHVPLTHHHKNQQTNYGHHTSIPLSHHQKQQRIPDSKNSVDSHLAQPYDMTKSRSTGTALSSKTQKTSNRDPNNNSLFATNYQNALSKKSGSTTNNPPSSPRQEYIQTHKSRVDMARRYMKQHGRYPRSRSPNIPPAVPDDNTDPSEQTSEVVNGNARIIVEHGNRKKHTSFRVA